MIPRSACSIALDGTKGWAKGSSRVAFGPMSAISDPGQVRTRRARSTTSRPTGRANIPESISPAAAVFCKRMPIPASRTYTNAARMAPRSSARRRAGRICAALAIVLGPMAENGSLHDVWTSTRSEIAKEALDRIGKLYDIERRIAGQSAELRRAVRQEKSKPLVETFRTWAERQLTRIPGKSDLAKAFRYGLGRWDSFCLFLGDGRVAIDNNGAERGMRPIGVGRRNWLFAGSDTGGETLARAMTIIETAKMNDLDPQAYLADVLDRIHDHKINRLAELLPWNWVPAIQSHSQAA